VEKAAAFLGVKGEGVAVSSLREDLLRIPGIEVAELEGDASAPDGVRVRLQPGVDVDSVGEEIRRVLASHGLRSELTDRFRPRPITHQVERPSPTPPAAGEEWTPSPPLQEVPSADRAPVSKVEEAESTVAVAPPAEVEPEADEGVEEGGPVIILDSTQEEETWPPSWPEPTSLESVAVEEGRMGVVVRVTSTSGTVVDRPAVGVSSGIDEAITAAVASLFGADPAPVLLSVTESEIAGTAMVTIVLEAGRGARLVGSAVLDGGRAYAVGRAAWAALSSV
jgi:hypothetical protein